jgi:hypothetical protein
VRHCWGLTVRSATGASRQRRPVRPRGNRLAPVRCTVGSCGCAVGIQFGECHQDVTNTKAGTRIRAGVKPLPCISKCINLCLGALIASCIHVTLDLPECHAAGSLYGTDHPQPLDACPEAVNNAEREPCSGGSSHDNEKRLHVIPNDERSHAGAVMPESRRDELPALAGANG